MQPGRSLQTFWKMDRACSGEMHINLYQTITCYVPEDSNLKIVTCTYGSKLFVCITCEKVSEKCHGTKHIQTVFEKEGVYPDSITTAVLYKKW